MAVESIRREAAPSSPRGDDTRRRLIDAALQIFGSYGFEGASTRTVAEQAGANLAAIPYYFGSKEGLYRAAAHSIVEDGTREMLPVFERIDRALSQKGLTREAATLLLHELLEHFTTLVIGSQRADSWSRFIMREQLQPGAAFDILFEGVMRRNFETCVRLLANLLKLPPKDTAVAVRAQAILGQVLVFNTCGEAVLRLIGWKEYSPEHVSMIRAVVHENIDRIVGAPAMRRQSHGSRKIKRTAARHE